MFLWMLIDEQSALIFLSLTIFHLPLPHIEYYRLFSPCFLHFGLLHIAFNLVMWEALARPIEKNFCVFKLVLMFLSMDLSANILQLFFINEGGIFGGLSGVVYGVMGYLGVLSRRDNLPVSLNAPKGLFVASIIFIAVGFLFSGIANFCHLGGFVIGVLWGLVDYSRKDLFK